MILVVDDNVWRRERIAEELEAITGQKVQDAGTPEEALEIIREAPETVEVVITNYRMVGSEMTGAELAERIVCIPEAHPAVLLWTKKIEPAVVSPRFRAMLQKEKDIGKLVGAACSLLTSS